VQRKVRFGLGAVLVAAVVAAYLPALGAGFIWNDDTYLTDNPTLDAAEGLRLIWTEPKASEQYYPMVFTSFWLEKRLWSLRPFGYHLVNVLLHAASALLLWAFLRRLLLPGAWLAAAVFALHPMCVESVAWVTERKNTLSLFLSLLALLAYGAALDARAKAAEPRKKRKPRTEVPWYRRPAALYTAALAAFTLALFAKTTASVVPAVLLVLAWWRRGRVQASDVRPVVPFLAIGAGLAFHTAWLERTMVQATGREWALGLLGRVVLAGKVSAFYAGKLLVPAGLTFIYPRWVVDPHVWSQWIPAIAGVALLAAAWVLRGRIGRGPLTGVLLFAGVLFPAMGFFNVYAMRYSWVADHFAYQAVAVAAGCVVCGIASLLPGPGTTARRAAGALALVVLAVFGVTSFRQSRIYRSEDTLWKDTLEKNPDCFMCHTNYGDWLVNHGRADEAVEHFEKSLELRPDNVPTLLNLARVEEQRGRLDEAAARLRAARRIDPADTLVLINLATINTKAGRFDEAVAEYREALRLGSPDDYMAHNGLGAALMGQGKGTEAVEHFREALRLKPDYSHARDNLERALAILNGRAPLTFPSGGNR
jgi:tetratricopeptide (TPR) repeat protein